MEPLKISFKGTDYLGISSNIEFQKLLTEGFEKYGSSFGGSRLSGSFSELFFRAENLLAQISGAEAALSFSSGTLAGLVLINSLNADTKLIYAPDAHPALSPPKQDRTNLSFNEWKRLIYRTYKETTQNLTILSNSVNPLNVEKYDFLFLSEIADNKKITLIVDDSHGFGILGKNGSGIYKNLPNHKNIEKIVISSLNKAWAVPGGVVLASKKIIEQLKKAKLFGGASPIIPAYLHAFLQSERIYQLNRKRLKNNILLFLNNINNKNIFTYFENFPVFYTDHHEIYDKLLKKGIDISSFNYPSPTDKRYTRIVITAKHTEKEITELCFALNEL